MSQGSSSVKRKFAVNKFSQEGLQLIVKCSVINHIIEQKKELVREDAITSNNDVTRFSPAKTTPPLVFNPVRVEPSCNPYQEDRQPNCYLHAAMLHIGLS
jgi:hypothetical protein